MAARLFHRLEKRLRARPSTRSMTSSMAPKPRCKSPKMLASATDASGDQPGHQQKAEELFRAQFTRLQHAGPLEQHKGDGPKNHHDDEARKCAPPKGSFQGNAPNCFHTLPVAGESRKASRAKALTLTMPVRVSETMVLDSATACLGLLGHGPDEPAKEHGGEDGHRQRCPASRRSIAS